MIRDLIAPLRTGGNLTSDAHLAALALEHGAELCSTDNDSGGLAGSAGGTRWPGEGEVAFSTWKFSVTNPCSPRARGLVNKGIAWQHSNIERKSWRRSKIHKPDENTKWGP